MVDAANDLYGQEKTTDNKLSLLLILDIGDVLMIYFKKVFTACLMRNFNSRYFQGFWWETRKERDH
jgi:hypothetical protein